MTGEHVVDGHLLTGEHDRSTDAGRIGDDVMAGDPGAAPVRSGQSRQDVHHGRLARPVRPEQTDNLAVTDLKADVAQGVNICRTTC